MASTNKIRIGVEGDLQELPAFGRIFSTGYEEGLTREDRSADGTLRRDVIARKKNFRLSYSTADQSVVDRLEELYNLDSVLILEITHLTTVTQYEVLMSPFERERLLATWGGLWNGVTAEFRQV